MRATIWEILSLKKQWATARKMQTGEKKELCRKVELSIQILIDQIAKQEESEE